MLADSPRCMTIDMASSYKRGEASEARSKAVTVRVPSARLQRLMRARKASTQSELINTLLAEEEERQRSHATLLATARTAPARNLDDRLL